MRRTLRSLVLCPALLLSSPAFAQTQLSSSSSVAPSAAQPSAGAAVKAPGSGSTFRTAPKLSSLQVEEIVKPIALYPDPLLGLILPASVFPDQIADAALLIKTKEDAELIAEQEWDASVKGVATYPGVLKMMYEKLDWTARLGDVFLNQSDDLRKAIQNLRAKAQLVGNLKTTDEQTVTTKQVDNGQSVIVIEPTAPQTVYVPQYTQTVYTEPAPSTNNYLVPLATFGLGMALGSALSDDDDDDVYVYGGYPGRVAWYNNDVDDWVDRRQDMIKDAQNFRQDRLEDRTNYRQDMREDRQSFRQDQIESGNWNRESAEQYRQNAQANRQARADSARQNAESRKANMSDSQRQAYEQRRQDAQSRANTARQSAESRRSTMSDSQRQAYEQRRQQAQQRSQEWKSSTADRGWKSSSGASAADRSAARPSRSSGSSSSAFSGYSSRSSASAYGSRGAASRSSSGYSSRGSYATSRHSGSYARSGASRSGGFSRGGGGGGRGGGRGGRR